MGIFSDLRKLIFGVKSVSKSAGKKTIDYGKDVGEDIKEKAEDVYDKTKDVLSDAGETVMEKTSGLRDAISDQAEKIVDKGKDLYESLGENENVQKAADFTESVGEKVIETGAKASEKFKDVAEDVGEKVLEAKDKLVERAKEVGDKLSEKFDETMEKAQEMAEKEKNTPKKEFADTPIDTDDSLLDDKDDFFAKASKYADGDYDAFSEGKITITDAPKSLDKPADKTVKAAGFEDIDGDGDEIIDDAIISEESIEPAEEASPDSGDESAVAEEGQSNDSTETDSTTTDEQKTEEESSDQSEKE